MKTLATLTREGFTSTIVEDADGKVTFIADADIDADGSSRSYHPNDTGTDFLANAKNGDEWVGVLTRNGIPIVQGIGDPAPGYYISSTAYEWSDQPKWTQRRFVNGENVSFAVVPPIIISGVAGVVKGARCRMTNLKNGMVSEGMVGDVGPRTKCGEVSPKAARELGLNPSPKYGGTDEPIIRYEIWPDQPAIIAGKPVRLMRANGTYV